jgi:transposase-like protein
MASIRSFPQPDHTNDEKRALVDLVSRPRVAAADRGPTPAPRTSPDAALDEHAWYRYDRLAQAFGVSKGALRKRLDRFREKNLNGWKENEDRRPREPRYFYQLKYVRPVLQDLRASSERPAKRSPRP